MPKNPKSTAPKVDDVAASDDATETAPTVVPVAAAPDPKANFGDLVSLVGRLYEDAGVVSEAFSVHIRATVGDPALHGRLHRVQMLFGGLRHELKTALLSTA